MVRPAHEPAHDAGQGLRDDDTGPGPARRQGRAGRRARAAWPTAGTRACPSASWPPASARASTCTAPSATRRSAPATSPPSSAATTASSRAPSTPRASCATTRCTSGSTRTTSCSQWRRERGRPARAAGRHRRPAADRHAAPGPDLLAEPRRLRPAARRGARLRGVPRRPAAALRQAADDRGHDPAAAVTRGRRGRDLVRPAGHVRSRAPRSRSPPPGRDPYASTPTPTGEVEREVELRRGGTSSRSRAVDPDTGKQSRGPGRACSSRCRSWSIEAPTLTVDQPAEGATFENGAIPVQGRDDERRVGRRQRRVHRPRRARRRAEGRDPAPPAAPAAGHRPGRRGRHVHARRSS